MRDGSGLMPRSGVPRLYQEERAASDSRPDNEPVVEADHARDSSARVGARPMAHDDSGAGIERRSHGRGGPEKAEAVSTSGRRRPCGPVNNYSGDGRCAHARSAYQPRSRRVAARSCRLAIGHHDNGREHAQSRRYRRREREGREDSSRSAVYQLSMVHSMGDTSARRNDHTATVTATITGAQAPSREASLRATADGGPQPAAVLPQAAEGGQRQRLQPHRGDGMGGVARGTLTRAKEQRRWRMGRSGVRPSRRDS